MHCFMMLDWWGTQERTDGTLWNLHKFMHTLLYTLNQGWVLCIEVFVMRQDYPSVGQILELQNLYDVTTIFAIQEDHTASYEVNSSKVTLKQTVTIFCTVFSFNNIEYELPACCGGRIQSECSRCWYRSRDPEPHKWRIWGKLIRSSDENGVAS